MNATELSARLSDQASSIVEYLLPRGKKSSGEWKVGGISGEDGTSLSVRVTGAKRGVWKDFATGEGGDLIDLWAAVRGQSIGEAMADIRNHLGIRDEAQRPPEKKWSAPDRSLFRKAGTEVVDWLMRRGLTAETIQAFKIAQQQRDGSTYCVFPYLRQDGTLVNTKARNIEDKRDMRQSTGAQPCLFGWHLVSQRARQIVICEGEIDAMTLYQMGIPALSVNAGAGNHQWIETDWDKLLAFSTIYLCYDSDDAGKKGAAEVAQRLGNDRCKMVELGAKDANQWLAEGAQPEQFITAVARARTMDPAELRSLSDFMADVKELLHPQSQHSSSPQLRLGLLCCPWFEFRSGELTVWTGYNGHGKSLLLNQTLLGLVEQGERACVFSGEMMPAYQFKRLVKQAGGVGLPTGAYIDAIGEWVQDRWWIFNVVGAASISRLTEVFSYAHRRYGITQFVVDSLMMCDVPEDGPGAHSKQKEAIQALAGFAKSHNSHVHLVAHPRKGADETNAPGKLDVAGSSRITDGADNVFSVWSARRDADDPDRDKPDALLELQKQRNGEIQHKKQWLWFDPASMQYTGDKRRRPHRYVNFNDGGRNGTSDTEYL